MSRRPGTPRLLREINDRTALELLLDHGSMTRAQLVEETGLSKPTASQLLARLQTAGLVTITGLTAGARGGPNAQVYALDPDAGHVVGVDVTPRETTAAAANIKGEVLATAVGRIETRRAHDRGDVARLVHSCVQEADIPMSSVGRVVVASPGVHDPDADEIKHAEHMRGWARRGVGAGLAEHLGMPVVIENDVNVVAVAERLRGAAKETDSFALLWVGNGLGLAIDLGGRVHRGATGGAGEVGYMPLPGFAESSTRRPVDFQTLVRERAVLALARKHGLRGRAAEVVVRRALDGASGGQAFLDQLAERLATGIAMIVSVLDPQMIVLAGATSLAGGEPLRARIQDRLRALTPLRPLVALSAIEGNPVLAGALDVALGALRDDLFTSMHSMTQSSGVAR